MGQTEEIILLCNWPTFYLGHGLGARTSFGSARREKYDGEAGEEHTRVGAFEPAEVLEHGARRRRSTVAGLMLLREFPQPA